MKTPALAGDAFLADVAAAGQNTTVLHLWWLGQSGFLLQWQGKHLLIDPYLSDSLTEKYAGTDKPHVRLMERVIAPERLDFIDVVLSTHKHTDHLDGETLGPMLRVNPKLHFIVPDANRIFVAERLGVPPGDLLGSDHGVSIEVGGFVVHGVPAAHESVELDSRGRCHALGYVVQAGPWTVYHSGDTVLYPGMVETLSPWGVDVALLPINGRKEERRVAGNLDGREAAQLGKDIGAGLVIPCHYDMFEFNTAEPDEFIEAARALDQPFCVLGCGERCSLDGDNWSSARRGGAVVEVVAGVLGGANEDVESGRD